jgi:hypothetical protein
MIGQKIVHRSKAKELRHWKDDSNPYSLRHPSERDKLSAGLPIVSGDVPKSPFPRRAGLLPSAGMIYREIAASFGSPLRFILLRRVPLSKRPAMSF